jgi:hypothetical protein
MMAEQDPSIGRMVILSVIKPMCRGNPASIEYRNASRQKHAVVAIRNRHHRHDSQQQWHRVHKDLQFRKQED